MNAANFHAHISMRHSVHCVVQSHCALERSSDTANLRVTDGLELLNRADSRFCLGVHFRALDRAGQNVNSGVARVETQRTNRQARLNLNHAVFEVNDFGGAAANVNQKSFLVNKVVRRADKVVSCLVVAAHDNNIYSRAIRNFVDGL